MPTDESRGISRKQIAADIRLLRESGFRSIVTYGSDGALQFIPEIARQEGFDGTIIMGIWDPFSDKVWNNALAQNKLVDGYCLGIRFFAAYHIWNGRARRHAQP